MSSRENEAIALRQYGELASWCLSTLVVKNHYSTKTAKIKSCLPRVGLIFLHNIRQYGSVKSRTLCQR
ncbi:hypothetical protein WKK05_10940 [Nostoc sp. UHCC 0302]|uniref:hypothetical protein n=1 Tax=Nostoc sp. UHCC 0302 TaxID=3134896 RepID=UPI00311C923F